MNRINKISNDLFNKIRGRFPNVTIGDKDGNITNNPHDARFFDFNYEHNGNELGAITIKLEDNKIIIIFSKDFVSDKDEISKSQWFDFLKGLRVFSRKRRLRFDVRDITKTNLNKRDYKFLAKHTGEDQMNESAMYGTSRVSYQNINNARLVIKHSQPINTEKTSNRSHSVNALFIESNEGERFKYPFNHLNGARAMARHVSEGGTPFDQFGQHIVDLSEELSKLRKFKSYMNRSGVMAESLSQYTDVIKERMNYVKKEIMMLQKESYYTEAKNNFKEEEYNDVPDEIRENWIDQLTIKQFNEELADIFPYIYRLISEKTSVKELGPDDFNLSEESTEDEKTTSKKVGNTTDDNEDDEKDLDESVKPHTPLSEFIMSFYDSTTGKFPKGETAVLTMVEKSYGDRFVTPAKTFIERVNTKFEEFHNQSSTMIADDTDLLRIKDLAGLQ